MARAAATCAALALLLALPPATAQPLAAYKVTAGEVAEPLAGLSGDEGRGRAIVANRQVGLCLLCHTGPIPEERFQGNLAPSLAGAGARWTPGQLRLRMIDARRLNPQSIMPTYYGTAGLERVGAAWQGLPLLSAQQVEDVVAYLTTLKN